MDFISDEDVPENRLHHADLGSCGCSRFRFEQKRDVTKCSSHKVETERAADLLHSSSSREVSEGSWDGVSQKK